MTWLLLSGAILSAEVFALAAITVVSRTNAFPY